MSSGVSSATTTESAVLVKSKYSIAWRNRSAKLQFLNASRDKVNDTNNPVGMSRFQRNTPTRRSLPGYSRTETPFRYGRDIDEDEAEFDKRDLSIPGTPVSSRHVMSLKYRNQLAEREKEARDRDFENKLQSSDDPLLKFIEAMKKLAATKRADLEQGIVAEHPKPTIQTPPSPLPRSKFGYNRMGSWNGDSNLRAYTPLFQRSMTVKLSSMNVQTPKPNAVNDKSSSQSAAGSGSSQVGYKREAGKSQQDNGDRPNLPKPPTSLIINPKTASFAGVAEEKEGDEMERRRPLKHRSLSNADTFYEIHHRLER